MRQINNSFLVLSRLWWDNNLRYFIIMYNVKTIIIDIFHIYGIEHGVNNTRYPNKKKKRR